MCGRFAFYDIQKFYSRFNVKNNLLDLKGRYNIAPGYGFPVVKHEKGDNKVEIMKWGLVPFWAKDQKIGYRMINARAETLSSKPAFRKSLRTKRCLIPANGFYEWDKQNGKLPYFIKRKDSELFAMAGIYDIWKDAGGRGIKTFTIITVDANKLVAKIHDRMPAILKNDDEDIWMDDDIEMNKILKLLVPYKGNDIEMYRVSKKVNKPIYNEPGLIKPDIGE